MANHASSTHRPCATEEERKSIRRTTWLGLFCNVTLSTIKCLVGFVAHSQALIADGIHSLADITTDIAILLGERFWLAPADKNHPYGHRRIEAMITVLIAILLAISAIGIGAEALKNLHNQIETPPGWSAFVVALISIFIKEVLFRYTHLIGIRIRSSALKANAIHHRSDAWSSIPVALAVLTAILFPQWAFVDQVGALIVAPFILYSAWDIAKPALGELSDSGACFKTQQHILSIAKESRGVQAVHGLRTRRSGPGYFVDLHVLVNPEISVREGHDIAVDVKRQLLATGPEINDVLIHIEPFDDPKSEEDHH